MEADNGTVLLVEDEVNLLNSLSFIFKEQGFCVLSAKTGEEGVALAIHHQPQLVLIDIGLPGMDGFDVAEQLKTLRKKKNMILVFLTGSNDEDDIVRAFSGLVDDYIVKPVRPRVLIARIKALLSRNIDTIEEIVTCGHIVINTRTFEVTVDNNLIMLTPTEFKILLLLAENPGKVFKRCHIMNVVYGQDCVLTDKSIDFQIHGLRNKLGVCASMLKTVRGVGFRLCSE